MPFTFAHPAIVLPFVHFRRVSATGLIVGAMAPDFEYFLRMKVESTISHTFLGLFVFNLPVAILIALLFHQIIKKELIVNLPVFFQSRLESVKNFNWVLYLKSNFLVVCVSVVIGAFSHLFWDAFTHKTGYFVENLIFLQSEVMGCPIYKIVQHSSTLLGLFFIIYVFSKLPFSRIVFKGERKLKFWMSVFLLTFLFQIIRFSAGECSSKIGNLIVSSISLFFVALLLVCLLSAFQKKKSVI